MFLLSRSLLGFDLSSLELVGGWSFSSFVKYNWFETIVELVSDVRLPRQTNVPCHISWTANAQEWMNCDISPNKPPIPYSKSIKDIGALYHTSCCIGRVHVTSTAAQHEKPLYRLNEGAGWSRDVGRKRAGNEVGWWIKQISFVYKWS